MLPKDSQKSYRSFTQLNLATGLLLSLLVINTAFNWKFAHPLTAADNPFTLPTESEDGPEKLLPPLPPAPVQPIEASQPKQGIIIEIENTSELTEAPQIPDLVETPPVIEVPTVGNLLPPEPVDTDTYAASAYPKAGMDTFMRYIMKRVTYPDYLRDSGKSGRVLVSFTIDETGKISDVRIKNGLDEAFDARLIKIIQEGPDWVPAYQDGRPTRSRRILPLQFTLR